jgi:hypothetical protein
MATEVGSAYVSIIPSAKGFGSTLNRGIGRQVDQSGTTAGKRFGGRFSGGMRPGLALAGRGIAGLVGPLAVLGGVRVLGNFVTDARESARVSALTAQAIKSTGGAANVSAKEVARLSTAISNKTGVDDEQIQSGANLLLTFTNIRNGLGKNNKIFDKANQTVTDMSAALGQDTKSSAIQLGKALNDPVKGITALSRVGVAFTDDQKNQIKTMTENGNRMGAQKVILAELKKEFGGAAEAMATPMDKLKVTLGNLGESLGAEMIPLIDRFAKFMVKKGVPALMEFGGFVKRNILPPLKTVFGFIGKLISGFSTGFKTDGLAGGFARIGGIISAAWPTIKAKLTQVGRAFIEWIGPQIQPMLTKLGQLLGRLGQWIVDTGLPKLRAKVAQWGRAFITWIGPQIQPMLTKLGKLLGRIATWVQNVGLPKLVAQTKKWGTALVNWIAPRIPGLLGNMGKLIGKLAGWLITTGLPRLMKAQAKMGAAFIKALPGAFKGLFQIGRSIIWGLIKGIGSMVGELAKALVNVLPGPLKKFAGKLGISSPSKVFARFGANLGDGLVLGINSTAKRIDKTVSGVATRVSTGFGKSLTQPTPPKVGGRLGVQAQVARQADVRRGGPGGQINVQVHNPKPERASESVPRAVQRATRNAGWAAA